MKSLSKLKCIDAGTEKSIIIYIMSGGEKG